MDWRKRFSKSPETTGPQDRTGRRSSKCARTGPRSNRHCRQRCWRVAINPEIYAGYGYPKAEEVSAGWEFPTWSIEWFRRQYGGSSNRCTSRSFTRATTGFDLIEVARRQWLRLRGIWKTDTSGWWIWIWGGAAGRRAGPGAAGGGGARRGEGGE